LGELQPGEAVRLTAQEAHELRQLIIKKEKQENQHKKKLGAQAE
jgi:hypothetical protein